MDRLFFFKDGTRCAALPSDDPLIRSLTELANEVGCEVCACVAAAERRDVITATPPFELVGLGQLIESVALADRHVTFA